MGHPNRAQVRVPRRLLDELLLALAACVEQMEAWDRMEDRTEDTRRARDFARRTLAEARRRLERDDSGSA